MEEVALTGLAPLVTKANCSAQLRHFCSQAGQERLHSVAMVTSWTSRADSQQDVANFLLCAPPLAADHLTDRWPWPMIDSAVCNLQNPRALCLDRLGLGRRVASAPSRPRPRSRPPPRQLLRDGGWIGDIHANIQQVESHDELRHLECFV